MTMTKQEIVLPPMPDGFVNGLDWGYGVDRPIKREHAKAYARAAVEADRAALSTASTAPAAASPDVAELTRVLFEEIGTYSVQCAKTGELAPSKSLLDAIDALGAAATQARKDQQ